MTVWRLFAIVAILSAAGSLTAALAQERATGEQEDRLGGLAVGNARIVRNLAVYPVYTRRPTVNTEYLSLDEAFKLGVIRVREAGEVNTLLLSNLGSRPIFIMAGEVVLGGKQDRCVGSDVLLPPGAQDVPVTVFCVEHGRWSGEEKFGKAAPSLATPDIREHAVGGAFAAARAAAPMAHGQRDYAYNSYVAGEQQQVWDSVARKTQRFRAESSTGTYRRVLELDSAVAQRSIAPYVQGLSAALERESGVVGVIAVVNGRCVAADVFSDPALFRRLWPKLVRSYAQAAAEAGDSRARGVPPPSAARSFLARALTTEHGVTVHTQHGYITQSSDAATVSYQLRVPSRSGGVPAATPVHSSVLGR